MPITDQKFNPAQPVFHAHLYVAGVDLVGDLNDWATSLFSPLYGPANPAFGVDATGAVHANQEGRMTLAVLDGFWIVFAPSGSISILAPITFEGQFVPEG